MKNFLLLAIAVLFIAGCAEKQQAGQPQLLEKTAFETTVDGKQVSLYTLKNADGMVLELTNYGNRMVSLWVRAKKGGFKDVLWGFESIDGYLNATDSNSGPVVGRYGNRIALGKYSIDGVEYQGPINNGVNMLHGGPQGWSTKVWDVVEYLDSAGNQALKMTLVSPDGDAGFPGNVTIEVRYTLTAQNMVHIDYSATTDAPTILNPTSHAYFNLHGTSTKSALSHVLTINADAFTPTDSGLIPTGEILSVEGTPLDFRTPRVIGERIDSDYEAIVFGEGYDHNFVINRQLFGEVSLAGEVLPAGEVYEPQTGIVMNVYTDQPGMQFYSGNFMDGVDVGKRGDTHDYRSGIALETQNFPDAPNHENFPSAILRPGKTYKQRTIYAFSVK